MQTDIAEMPQQNRMLLLSPSCKNRPTHCS